MFALRARQALCRYGLMAKLPVPPASGGRLSRHRPVKCKTVRDVEIAPGVPALLEVPACSHCGAEITGPPQKRYCSDACRVKAHRARKAGTSVSADTLVERARCATIARQYDKLPGSISNEMNVLAVKIAEEIERGE